MSVPPPPPPKGIREVKDGVDWARTKREEVLQSEALQWKVKECSFHWYEFGIGISVTSLFWGVMFKMFGGS